MSEFRTGPQWRRVRSRSSARACSSAWSRASCAGWSAATALTALAVSWAAAVRPPCRTRFMNSCMLFWCVPSAHISVPTRSAAATWLECAGFATLRCTVTHSPAAVIDALVVFTANQHTLGFPCDGLVVSLDSKVRQRDLGATSRAPRWSIGLKP